MWRADSLPSSMAGVGGLGSPSRRLDYETFICGSAADLMDNLQTALMTAKQDPFGPGNQPRQS